MGTSELSTADHQQSQVVDAGGQGGVMDGEDDDPEESPTEKVFCIIKSVATRAIILYFIILFFFMQFIRGRGKEEEDQDSVMEACLETNIDLLDFTFYFFLGAFICSLIGIIKEFLGFNEIEYCDCNM